MLCFDVTLALTRVIGVRDNTSWTVTIYDCLGDNPSATLTLDDHEMQLFMHLLFTTCDAFDSPTSNLEDIARAKFNPRILEQTSVKIIPWM